jgi:hypothetical protein
MQEVGEGGASVFDKILQLFFLLQFSVVILSVRGVLVRKFMIAAHSLGMTKGDWTFLDVEIFQVSFVWGQVVHREHTHLKERNHIIKCKNVGQN